MSASYGFTSCATIECPRSNDPDAPSSQLKSQMLQDVRGNYWCSACTRRYELMNWGHERHWPVVRVQGKMKYTVYSDADNWFSSIVLASQDMVNALYETLIEQKRAQLDLHDHTEGIARMNAWFDAFEEATETIQRRTKEDQRR